MKALIFENSLSGHRGHYVGVLARQLLQFGVKLVCALPGNVNEDPAGQEFLSDILSNATHHELPMVNSSFSVAKNGKTRFSMLQSCVEKFPDHYFFVPYADGISQAWGMKLLPGKAIGKCQGIEGLMMRGRFAYPEKNWKQRLSAEMSWQLQSRSRWDVLHQLDPLAYQEIERRVAKVSNRLIPDVIDTPVAGDKCAARKAIGIGTDKFVVACPGAVNERKGCDKLIDAVCHLKDPSIELVLHGKHSPLLETKVQRNKSGCVRSINRFASQEEFNDLFAAADLIAICYPRHIGSASILLRAIAAGKKIVASDWGWIGWATEAFQLGPLCNPKSIDSIAKAIANAKQSVDFEIGPAAKKFVSYHSPLNHVAHWTKRFCEFNGLPTLDRIEFNQIIPESPGI